MSNKIIAALDALAVSTPMNRTHAAAALCNLADDIRALATASGSPATSTVGELLEPEHVVEFIFEGDWHQAKRVDHLRHWQVRSWHDAGWTSWHDSDERVHAARHIPARVVPSAQVNVDPTTRGPIAKR